MLAIALVSSLAALAVGGGDSPGEATAPETTTTTTTAEQVTTTVAREVVSTTEPAGEEVVSGGTAVIVDNVPDVGLQVGIGEADLLLEIPVEGGVTRFTAVYGQQIPELVGPVRSLR
ncbi:MAG TPA: DUF3048 domain-containing protein, partial [Acidimicrobiia bacterium]|nr:DUF3048 domain-containing protein [Acidimicrobiia bacterium]